LTLIVCLPLALLGRLGVRLAHDEQAIVRQNVSDLLAEQLRETDQTIVGHFQRLESQLLEMTEFSSYDREHLRAVVRDEPIVGQVFVLESDGRLRHPDPMAPLNNSEREFLDRASPFLQDKDLIRAAALVESKARSNETRVTTSGVRDSAAQSGGHGWYVWFWERGVHLIFWRRGIEGHIVGVELVRPRWMADLIVELPQTPFDESHSAQTRIRLADSNDNTVYQWGRLEPKDDDEPFVVLPLSAPLTSWRLKYYVADEHFAALSGRSTYFNLLSGLAALFLAVVGLAVYFYRESSRELREAATRVNFVNQVSHELKTPLTNIRMYAELLERDLANEGETGVGNPNDRLRVILSESARLSRLIGNVLTFASQQNRQVKLNYTTATVDAVIRSVLEYFEPTLREKGVVVEFDGQASEAAEFDQDVFEQILVNLISNVEKYAAAGGVLRIESRQAEQRVFIVVADEGPGISAADRGRVFLPFQRGADRLEGAAGAGIGLSICRSLARLHGGDVVLVDAERGAKFQVELTTRSPKQSSA
jgi:signal transduction histidine kinase